MKSSAITTSTPIFKPESSLEIHSHTPIYLPDIFVIRTPAFTEAVHEVELIALPSAPWVTSVTKTLGTFPIFCLFLFLFHTSPLNHFHLLHISEVGAPHTHKKKLNVIHPLSGPSYLLKDAAIVF